MDVTCDDTLGIVLPALLRRNPRALKSGAVVQLIVPDEKDCRFFYRFSADDVTATRGVADDSDLTLSMIKEDLARFLDDTIDFEHAVKTRRVKVMGDASLLLGLADALRGAP